MEFIELMELVGIGELMESVELVALVVGLA